MHIIVNNFHNNDLSWLPKGEVTIYDKKELNVGSNIFDYMDWIVKNYDNLPDLMLFTKGNMLSRHITPEEWDKIKDNKIFTPILTQNHKVYDPICWYEDGVYCELNDYWYLREHPTKTVNSCNDLKKMLGIDKRTYNKFAPGACYIVPKENILKHPKEFYQELRDLCDWHATPGEAYLIERSLYHIWK